MILDGVQRGFGSRLATHLTNTNTNDHVEIHELRGFVSGAGGLHEWFRQIEAISKGTKAEQPFFSMIFSPPENSELTTEQFERAINKVEQDLPYGLENQPRAVVFHEKEGDRHAHVVWSRIACDGERMKAINLPFYKEKLGSISRELYREFGLEMPAGLKDRNNRDPNNFSRAIWQQAKRMKEDPRDLKQLIRTACEHSDSREAFAQALEQHALFLARGDRRGFVALHHSGEVLSISKYAGVKAKDLRERFGKEEQLRTLDQARGDLERKMSATLERHKETLYEKHKKEQRPYEQALIRMRREQREERSALAQVQKERWKSEDLTRAKRLRSGIMGLWDRFTGQHGRVSRQNRAEEEAAAVRDRQEKQTLINRHMTQRRALQNRHKPMRERHRLERQQLNSDLAFYLGMDNPKRREITAAHVRETGRNHRPPDRHLTL